MYLIERIIGVGTFCITLFIVFILIQYKKISLKKGLNIYLIILSTLAFFYIPPKGEDYYRIKQILDTLQGIKFENLYNLLINSSYPVAFFIYYLVSKINLYGMLPAVSTFFTYKNIFYIIQDTANKNKLTQKDTSWIFLFIMANGMFGVLISNIRTFWALSIIARCVYDEIINKKKIYKNLHLYIIAIFIHQISVLVVAYRFIYNIFLERKTKILYKIIIIFIIISSIFILNKYYLLAYNKFFNYLENNDYFLLADLIKMIAMNLFMLYSLYISNKMIVKGKEELYCEKNLIKYISILLILIVLLREYNIFIRVSYFCSILFIPIYAILIKNLSLLNNKKRYTRLAIFTTMFILLISATRGHLSSFKFLELK